jgi:hypothetical protein
MWLGDYKTDDRPHLPGTGWAPGWYTCTCIKCGEAYTGEKRSTECADCAYTRMENVLTEQVEMDMGEVPEDAWEDR